MERMQDGGLIIYACSIKKNVANAESEEAIREFKYFKRNKDLEQLLWGMGKEKK